jgi:hypothetical protein
MDRRTIITQRQHSLRFLFLKVISSTIHRRCRQHTKFMAMLVLLISAMHPGGLMELLLTMVYFKTLIIINHRLSTFH